MTLSQRKIDIITGVNDVPSSTGQPNHPNASLLCKKYNDLIDNELSAIQSSLAGIGNLGKTVNNINQYYLDLTASSQGDGTENSPFNTVQALVSVLNSSIFVNTSIEIFCLSDVDFGHLEITGILSKLSYESAHVMYIYPTTSQLITFDSIKSSIPIALASLTQNKNIFISNTDIFIEGDINITGGNFIADNSTIKLDTIQLQSPMDLKNSFLKLTNSTVTDSSILCDNGKLFFENLTLIAGDGTATFFNGITIDLIDSELIIRNATLANYSSIVFPARSRLYLDNVTYSQVDTSEALLIQGAGTTIITKDCTGLTHNGNPLLRIDDGVIAV